jgi:hypothetical protein
MKQPILITDIDGTLGTTQCEFRAAFQVLNKLSSTITICLITGRSLKALQDIEQLIPSGTLVSPWGGANLLCRKYDGYSKIGSIRILSSQTSLENFWKVCVPKKNNVSAHDEILIPPGKNPSSLYLQCVGAYREVTSNHGSFSRGSIHQGLNGTSWEIVTPWLQPRAALIRMVAKAYNSRVIYWGDDHIDSQAIGSATIVMAPRHTSLSEYKGVITYTTVEEAAYLIENLITPEN